jgi:hypothetical protein
MGDLVWSEADQALLVVVDVHLVGVFHLVDIHLVDVCVLSHQDWCRWW